MTVVHDCEMRSHVLL